MKERKDCVDDAMHATRAAVEEGIALWRCRAGEVVAGLDALKPANRDQEVGVEIVRRAQAPTRNIVENAGDEGSVIVGKPWRAKRPMKATMPAPANSPTW